MFFTVDISFSQPKSLIGNGMLARKNKKGKYGYVNTKGKKVVPYRFDYAHSFIENFAVVVIDSNFRYINPEGDYLSDDSFDLAWPFSQGIALVFKAGKYGYIDTSGRILNNKWFDKGLQLFDNYAEAKHGKTNYLISFQGQVMNYGNNIMPRKETEIFTVAGEMPKFPGGRDMFLQYFYKYQKQEKLELADGALINISFVVERDGSLSDIKILNQSNNKLSKDLIKLIKAMPPWITGKISGESVRVRHTMPLLLGANK